MTGHSIHDRRFHHSLTAHGRWIRERSHESYSKNYSVVFPHDEPLAGRNMRTDPLHEVPRPPPPPGSACSVPALSGSPRCGVTECMQRPPAPSCRAGVGSFAPWALTEGMCLEHSGGS